MKGVKGKQATTVLAAFPGAQSFSTKSNETVYLRAVGLARICSNSKRQNNHSFYSNTQVEVYDTVFVGAIRPCGY